MTYPIIPEPALSDVAEERIRQHAKWGEPNHPDGTGPHVLVLHHTDVNLDLRTGEELERIFTAKCQRNTPAQDNWRDILLEEVFEAMAEDDSDALRKELVQVAAVAVAWCGAIDRRSQR